MLKPLEGIRMELMRPSTITIIHENMLIKRLCSCSRKRLVFICLVLSVISISYLWSGGEGQKGAGGGGTTKASLTETFNFNVSYARRVMKTLCNNYRDNEVSGDYCNRLCFFEDHTFLDFFTGNKVVLLLTMGGQKTVLKSRHPYFDKFNIPNDLANLSENEFRNRVVVEVNSRLELGWPKSRGRHLIEKLWPAAKRSSVLSTTDRRSIWTLATQEEYLTFAVLPLARVFPRVLGSCGSFYAVEHVVPFKLKSYYTNLKAKILVHLMGTLKLFYEFLNEPLQWCDVKFENFGLSADYPKRFLVMDADFLFTETRMGKLLKGLKCNSNQDCVMMDCKATCDTQTHQCSSRTNDNIEVFCKKLVHQLFGHFWSKSNRYLAACHDPKLDASQRLKELRLVWAWSLDDV